MNSMTSEQDGAAACAATSEITTEAAAGVLRIQMNRPTKKNAMTFAMYAAIAELLRSADKDEAIRAVGLHGAGDCFTAGNDLSDFIKNPPNPEDSPQVRFTAALINFGKPLIAAVHGAAVGSGTTMLLHCDFVYAAQNARFQMPFVDLALVPELGSSFLLPARVGYIAAAELILLGAPFDADRALELGLVTRIVSDRGLMATAMHTAQRLAEGPAGAVQASKALLTRSSRELAAAAAEAEAQ